MEIIIVVVAAIVIIVVIFIFADLNSKLLVVALELILLQDFEGFWISCDAE